jgi:hypothetical protein
MLEYCCPVWHSSFTINLSDKIERVQKRTMRIIYPTLSYDAALDQAKCSTLRARRDALCIKTFDKMRQPDSRLNHLIPPSRANEHNCDLRYGNRLTLGSFRFDYEYDYEYEIRQAKRVLYAYAIPYWREKVVAVAHLSTKLWRNLVVLTTTFQKNKESWLFFVFQK